MTPLVQYPVSPVNNDMLDDKVAQQLLSKLDKGAETIANLHSLLMTKTSEMNQLIAQLELIEHVLSNVEYGTQQIENVLGLSADLRQDKLLDAEASLDSAIQSATNLYNNNNNNNNNNNKKNCIKKRAISRKSSQYEVTSVKKMLKKINDVLIELELNPNAYFSSLGTTDDVNVLQKAYVDLDVAKKIASSIKTNYRRKSALSHSKNASKLKQLDHSIRNEVRLFKNYSKDQPLLLNGVDILTILDREDEFLTKNLFMHKSAPTITTKKKNRLSDIVTTTTNNNNCNNNNMKQQQQPSPPCKKLNPIKQSSSPPSPQPQLLTKESKRLRQQEIIFQVSRPTSSSMAKIKDIKLSSQETKRGPGYTLRLRNLLAKRNINH